MDKILSVGEIKVLHALSIGQNKPVLIALNYNNTKLAGNIHRILKTLLLKRIILKKKIGLKNVIYRINYKKLSPYIKANFEYYNDIGHMVRML